MSEDSTDSFFQTAMVGDKMVTQGRTITDADVTNFAGVSGDFNHLHTDTQNELLWARNLLTGIVHQRR